MSEEVFNLENKDDNNINKDDDNINKDDDNINRDKNIKLTLTDTKVLENNINYFPNVHQDKQNNKNYFSNVYQNKINNNINTPNIENNQYNKNKFMTINNSKKIRKVNMKFI